MEIDSNSGLRLRVVLLLGSYDPDTRSIMDFLKGQIAERFTGENCYTYVLDELEVYSNPAFFVIAERWSEKKISIHVFKHEGTPEESYETEFSEREPIDGKVRSFLRGKYGEIKIQKVDVLQKVRKIMEISLAVVIIRDKEETRGGEVAEMVYGLLTGMGDRFCLFKREGFSLSSMLMEFLDWGKTVVRPYRTQEELAESVLRFLSHRVRNLKNL